LVGRTNADINAIKAEYQKVHRTSLEADLKADLSAGTEDMFLILAAGSRAEESAPVIPQQTETDYNAFISAMGSNTFTKNAVHACQILISKSNAQIRAIAEAHYNRRKKTLQDEIKSNFSGHMEKALVLLVDRAQHPPSADAELLEQAMAGPGTKGTCILRKAHVENIR
jgi:annexin A7/11